MTQSCPNGSEQKNFNVLLRRSYRRPDANSPTLSDLEVSNALYSDGGTFCRMLKYKSVGSFLHGRLTICNLNHDIESALIVDRCWHSSKRNFGIGAPATQHVCVGGSWAEV